MLVQTLKDKLIASSQEQSTKYVGETKLIEAWYLCSTMWVLNTVLFKIVKEDIPILQAVDEGIQQWQKVLGAPSEQIAERMLEQLKQALFRYEEGYKPL